METSSFSMVNHSSQLKGIPQMSLTQRALVLLQRRDVTLLSNALRWSREPPAAGTSYRHQRECLRLPHSAVGTEPSGAIPVGNRCREWRYRFRTGLLLLPTFVVEPLATK